MHTDDGPAEEAGIMACEADTLPLTLPQSPVLGSICLSLEPKKCKSSQREKLQSSLWVCQAAMSIRFLSHKLRIQTIDAVVKETEMCTDFTDCIKGYSRITFHAQEDDQKGNVCLHIHV